MGGRSIFITGGGSGIGRAVAQYFAARGWFVGLADVSQSGMDETSALLPPNSSSKHRLDVRDRAAWDDALADFSVAAGGHIDVVFNNAGVAFGGPLTDLGKDEIDLLTDINFRGVIYGAQAAYPHLKKTAPGSVLVNTASAAALYGTAGMSVYSATKFGVRAMTEALDVEWQDDHIRVCSLMPSFIDTPLLAGPASAKTNISKRESVVKAKLEFTPVEVVAETVWNAVHGKKLHNLVGKTAKILAFAAKWNPSKVRKRGKNLMRVRQGLEG